jgi:cytochrome bd-type quinol oxidase subunit 2
VTGVGAAADSAAGLARETGQSRVVGWLARLGLLGRSLLWFVLGLLAVQVAVGDSAKADREGALRAVAAQSLGEALLWAATAGFLGYAVWRGLAAAVGHRDEDSSRKRTLLRVFSATQVIFYGFLGFMTGRFVVGSGGSADQQRSAQAAQVLMLPGGRYLLGGVGVGLLAIGAAMCVLALRREHDDRLDSERIPDLLRRPAVAIGLVGRVAVGAFVIVAAVQYDPSEARGFDQAMSAVAAQPLGSGLLLAAALGLVAYGLWSAVEAACRRL